MLGSVAMGALLPAAGASPVAAQVVDASGARLTVNDTDILNFALNLEYLEAEFYNYSVYGKTIEQMGVPITGQGERGPTTGGAKTRFDNEISYATATELASDERDHVLLLRSVLGGSAREIAAGSAIAVFESVIGHSDRAIAKRESGLVPSSS